MPAEQLSTGWMDPATPSSESKESFLADSLYTQEEMDASEALLSVTRTVTSSNPTTASKQDQELTVFPWGGLTSNGITLTNTCQLDNWLMIFQALVKSLKVKLQDLPESGHTIATAMRLIDDGLHADAKLLILQSLPRQDQGTLLQALNYLNI